jgi:hypothetical protein
LIPARFFERVDAALPAPDDGLRSTPQPSSASVRKHLNGSGTYHVYDFTPPPPAEPTDALPGSEAKVAVMEDRWRHHRHIHHPLDEQAEERRDFDAFVVGGRKGGPARKYVYRRFLGRRYVWNVCIPTPEARIRAGPFPTAEAAIEARDLILAGRGLPPVDAAGDAPHDRRSSAPYRTPGSAMIHSTLPSQIAALAGRYVHAEAGSLDGPVKVTVHMTADLRLIGLNVEPVPAVAAVVPPARPRRRRDEFDHPA